MITLTLKSEEELEIWGRRVFKDGKFVGWVSYWLLEGHVGAAGSKIKLWIARLDVASSANVSMHQFFDTETEPIIQELMKDPVKEKATPFTMAQVSFPNREKIL